VSYCIVSTLLLCTDDRLGGGRATWVFRVTIHAGPSEKRNSRFVFFIAKHRRLFSQCPRGFRIARTYNNNNNNNNDNVLLAVVVTIIIYSDTTRINIIISCTRVATNVNWIMFFISPPVPRERERERANDGAREVSSPICIYLSSRRVLPYVVDAQIYHI